MRAAASVMKGPSRFRVAAAAPLLLQNANKRAARERGGGFCSRSAGVTRPFGRSSPFSKGECALYSRMILMTTYAPNADGTFNLGSFFLT